MSPPPATPSPVAPGTRPEHPCPDLISGPGTEHRCSVRDPVLLVQLVGEFVEDDVLTPIAIPLVRLYLVPGDDHPAHLPGLADAGLPPRRVHPGFVHQLAVHDKGRGVDQDRAQLPIIIGLAVQYEKTGLSGDEHPHGIGDLQPTAAKEALFGEKDQDMPPQLLPDPIRDTRVQAQPFEEDPLPFRRKRGASQPLATPCLERRPDQEHRGR